MSSQASEMQKPDRKSILSFFQPPKDSKSSQTENTDIVMVADKKDDENNKENIETFNISDSESEHEGEKENVSKTVLKSISLITASNEVDVKSLEGNEKENVDNLSKEQKAKKRREELQKQKQLKLKVKEEEKKRKELQREKEKLEREKKLQEEKKKRELKAEEVKRKREELRLAKEAEKLKREEERLAAKRKRDEEKQAKEDERIAKEAEKKAKEEAKERAQSRIGNFFKKVDDSGTTKSNKTDYEKYFLKFYDTDGIQLSTDNQLSPELLKESINKLDTFLSKRADDNSDDINQWLEKRSKRRGYKVKNTAVNLLQQMTSKEKGDDELQAMLSLIPSKYIKFYENVRPPYIGTYSKDVILPVDNPFSTEGTGYSYDYDSDLEWINEEEEEGGEIDNLESGEDEEEDEDEEEASDGEFDGFLDSEEKKETKKKKFIGPLIPVVHLRNKVNTLPQDDQDYFEQVSVEFLLDPISYPIEPTSTPAIVANKNNNVSNEETNENDNNSQKRPSSTLEGETTGTSTPGSSPEKKKQKCLITETKDLVKLFDTLQDSTFSLGTVTEIVQKHIPHYNKQTIKNTVKEYAVRSTGKGDTPRKWTIKDTDKWNTLRSDAEKEQPTLT